MRCQVHGRGIVACWLVLISTLVAQAQTKKIEIQSRNECIRHFSFRYSDLSRFSDLVFGMNALDISHFRYSDLFRISDLGIRIFSRGVDHGLL